MGNKSTPKPTARRQPRTGGRRKMPVIPPRRPAASATPTRALAGAGVWHRRLRLAAERGGARGGAILAGKFGVDRFQCSPCSQSNHRLRRMAGGGGVGGGSTVYKQRRGSKSIIFPLPVGLQRRSILPLSVPAFATARRSAMLRLEELFCRSGLA